MEFLTKRMIVQVLHDQYEMVDVLMGKKEKSILFVVEQMVIVLMDIFVLFFLGDLESDYV